MISSLYKAIKGYVTLKRKGRQPPIKIVIGAAGVSEGEWIATDIEYLNLLKPSHWKRYFKINTIEAILAEHVWEHLTQEDGLTAARQCFQYLKPGGYLRVAVPDGFHPDPDYIELVKVGGTGLGSSDHKVLYNYETLKKLFEKAGYEVRLLEYFDKRGSFKFLDWDEKAGKIFRSKRFDERNINGKLNYTSIILDAYKIA
jgi:predicted SAM-dependent methyltransferase